MAVRVPDIPGLQGSAINAPTVRPGAASAPARALGSVATAIGSVGSAFAEHADRIQAAENQRAISTTRSQLDEMRSGLFIDLQSITDPAEQISRTDTFLQEAKAIVENPDHAPIVRDRLLPYFDGWATDTRTTVAERAANLSRKRADIASQNELEHAIARGDRSLAEGILNERVANGLQLPEEADQVRGQLDRQITFRAITEQIDEDPLAAGEQVTSQDFLERYPELTIDDANRLESYADQSHNRAAADFWNEATNAAMDGTVLAPEDLSELADQGLISASQRASYLRAYHGNTPPQADPVLYDQIHSAIMRYDPGTDPTGLTLATLRTDLATAPLPKEHVSELRDRLDDQAKPPGSRTTKHRLAADFQKITDERFDAGDFGKWFTLSKGPRGGETKTISREDFEAAILKKREFLDVWSAYMANAPDDLPTTEAQAAYQSIYEATVMAEDSFDLLELAPNANDDLLMGELEGLGIIDQGPGVLPAREPTASTFGGVKLERAGHYYQNAKPTVFGGSKDPADNGKSAFGGVTGKGGREGVAIPQKVLEATFPGTGKKWWAENVRVVVKAPNGTRRILPLADLGTAEKVWKANGRPVLDLTPGALRSLGGRVITDENGNQAGVAGLDGLQFALTTIDAGMPLQGADWNDVMNRWFQTIRPTDATEIQNSFAALLAAYNEANAPD